jgi:hypothetical protein
VITEGRRHSIASRIETVCAVLTAGAGDVGEKAFVFRFEEMLLVTWQRRKRPDALSDLLIALRNVELRLVFINSVIRFVSHNNAFRMMYDDDSPPFSSGGGPFEINLSATYIIRREE